MGWLIGSVCIEEETGGGRGTIQVFSASFKMNMNTEQLSFYIYIYICMLDGCVYFPLYLFNLFKTKQINVCRGDGN